MGLMARFSNVLSPLPLPRSYKLWSSYRISRPFGLTVLRHSLPAGDSAPDSLSAPASAASSVQPSSLLSHLTERGLVESVTGPPGSLDALLRTRKITAYAGVDPTASSMHVGHLLPFMNLLHFYLNGHNSIALVGKATASVGDPSGRTLEREKATLDSTFSNVDSITAQVERFFTRGEEYALARGYYRDQLGTRTLRKNSEWLDGLGLVEFLSTAGRHIRVQQMLARQSVKSRMDTQKGINFAEFTYQLLQSYDFWHLYRHEDCRLQIGGNDQYGNITAGIDLIQKLDRELNPQTSTTTSSADTTETDAASSEGSASAYGLTVPLLTTPTGEKLGKSAGNAIWLDASLTSPFELYQFFARLPDASLPTLLPSLTLLPISEIQAILLTHTSNPELRTAQHALAFEVVYLVHGLSAAKKARVMTQLLFPPPPTSEGEPPPAPIATLTAAEIIVAFEGDKRMVKIPRAELLDEFVSKIASKVGAVKTRSEAEALIRGGGLYVYVPPRQASTSAGVVAEEGWRVVQRGEKVEEGCFTSGGGEVLLIRVGKGKVVVVEIV